MKAGRFIERVRRWCAMPSGSTNLPGLAAMADVLADELSPLADDVELAQLPPVEQIDERGESRWRDSGRAVVARKRAGCFRRVLLNIHYDTVYEDNHPLEVVEREGRLFGPGVADAKGGIAVMMGAIEAFESMAESAGLGWTVVLNPDEEIGSPGSAGLLAREAAGCVAGLLFEPAFADGALVGARKGSGTYTLVVRGRSAHAGKNFADGRSAIAAMAEAIGRLHAVNGRIAGVTVNVGRVAGGTAANVVADSAVARVNVRAADAAGQAAAEAAVREAVAVLDRMEGIRFELHGGFTSPPKPLEGRSASLMDLVRRCGREMGLELAVRDTGGASDANRLAARELAVVDSMGPCGGGLHSPEEFALVSSFPQRAELAARTLSRIAVGTWEWA